MTNAVLILLNLSILGCLFIFIVILVLIIVPLIFLGDWFEDTDGFQCAAFWGWMFFVLINAFYGGALTMFFTSEPTLPFSTVEEVMKLYPSFKLLMMNGNDVHFQYKALAVSQENKTVFSVPCKKISTL